MSPASAGRFLTTAPPGKSKGGIILKGSLLLGVPLSHYSIQVTTDEDHGRGVQNSLGTS